MQEVSGSSPLSSTKL